MTVEDFERVLRSCVDDASELNIADGRIRVEVRDELIEATLDNSSGQPHVIEDGDRVPAGRWLTRRVVRVQVLADRILAHVKREPFFIDPSGSMLSRNGPAPTGEEKEVSNICDAMLRSLNGSNRATTVHYLTSVPGGGTTTLINMAARRQAEKFKRKETGWLLVPISLQKRSFLGFDEIVLVELGNRLHYHLLYYDAIVELTRMGAIVPAFDGLEDMLTGQAGDTTAMAIGRLINDLDSRGSLVIVARKAHFEYPELEAQARLTHYLPGHKVKYVRTRLDLWSRGQFTDCAQRRGLHDGGAIHAKVEGCVGPGHALLTRPAMASRVLDAAEKGSLDGLLKDWRDCPSEYFRSLVEAIVTREAWAGSMFSVDEQHRLLANIAKEMWITSTNLFRRDCLEFIAKEFALECGKTQDAAHQLRTQITRHPLFGAVGQRYAFVHDDFRKHYLGEALGHVLVSSADAPEDVADFMHKGVLSSRAADMAVSRARREGVEMVRILALLQRIVDYAPLMSFARESAGALALRCLELVYGEAPVELSGFVFPTDGLRGRRLEAVSFRECRFHGTSLMGAQIAGCRFIDCTMRGLEWPLGFVANETVIRGGSVSNVVVAGGDGVCDPTDVAELLAQAGFRVESLAGTVRNKWDEPGLDAGTAEQTVAPIVGADPGGTYGYNNPHENKSPMERQVREGGGRSIGMGEARGEAEDKGVASGDSHSKQREGGKHADR